MSLSRVPLSLCLAAVLAGPAAGAPKRRAAAPPAFGIEHLLTLSAISDLVWSPDGRRLAFVVNAPDTAENSNNQDLWLAEPGRGEPIRLTRQPQGDWSPTFSPGGDTLAFVSSRGGGEDAKPAIHMLSLRGGEPWPFGTYDESVSEVAWSPDGRHLAFVKLDTLEKRAREWTKKKWDHVVEDRRLQHPHLWVVEVATGKQRRLTSGERHVWHARWSPDSRSIAFLVSPTGKPDDYTLADIGVVPLAGGPTRTLGVIGGAFSWSPDGRWIACATGVERDRYVQKDDLWLIPAAGGAPLNLTAGFDEDAKTPAWSPGSDTLYFHAARGASSVLAWVAVPRAGEPPGTVTLAADRAGEAGAPALARGGRAAWVQSRPEEPDEVWIADHPRLPGRAETALNAGVARLRLGATRLFSWRSTDGVAVEGVLLRPPGAREGAALKTLVALHGGPYGSRFGLGFQPVAQYFAARGYQVFMPNFRSSGGYGTAFMLRRRSDWGGQDWRDVDAGIDSLVRRGLADPRRLGVYGRSYGGYLTAWAITRTDRFDAACVFAGAVDLASFYGQSDVQKYRAFEFEGFPWETPDNWARSSPMTHIERVRTPTLIQVGQLDRRVPLPQAQQLYRALLGLGVPTEFVHYPREGHSVREPRHRADLYARMLGWWEKWIR